MHSIYQPVKTAARIGFLVTAGVLVSLVFVQVYHAGAAVLVTPGDWTSHTSLGHMFALPIMLLGALSVLGWMGWRLILASIGLFGLYVMQYVFLHTMAPMGLPALAALHPVNALVILSVAVYAGRAAWRLVTEPWEGRPAPRSGLAAGVILLALGAAKLALGSAAWEGGSADRAPSLAAASEANVPEPYRSMQARQAGAAAVAAGARIAEQRCIACHAPDYRGKQLGAVRSADLTEASVKRTEQFLMWAISDGSQQGMPPWAEQLSLDERWQLVAFIKSLAR